MHYNVHSYCNSDHCGTVDSYYNTDTICGASKAILYKLEKKVQYKNNCIFNLIKFLLSWPRRSGLTSVHVSDYTCIIVRDRVQGLYMF